MCVQHAQKAHSHLKEEREIYSNALNVLLEEFVKVNLHLTYQRQYHAQMARYVLPGLEQNQLRIVLKVIIVLLQLQKLFNILINVSLGFSVRVERVILQETEMHAHRLIIALLVLVKLTTLTIITFTVLVTSQQDVHREQVTMAKTQKAKYNNVLLILHTSYLNKISL